MSLVARPGTTNQFHENTYTNVMPMLSNLVNIISLPYQGQTNQIRETIITKIRCYGLFPPKEPINLI